MNGTQEKSTAADAVSLTRDADRSSVQYLEHVTSVR